MQFFQTLVHHYLIEQYKEQFTEKSPTLDYNASMKRKMDDSFGRYFIGENKLKLPKKIKSKGKRAHNIRGRKTEDYRMKLIEGSMSVKAIINEAKKHNTSLTVYIASLFIYSIYLEMNAVEKRRPIVLSVPINLRQFYESDTARNFFSTINIHYRFEKEKKDLNDIIESISELFQRDLTVENLNSKLNGLMSLEKNLFMRLLPLPIKDYAIRIANKLVDRGITGAISNVGIITIPEEFESYIRQFSISTSARRPQICLCSYKDRLTISFTSPFTDTEIQRTFFKFLSNKGIQIEISSNL